MKKYLSFLTIGRLLASVMFLLPSLVFFMEDFVEAKFLFLLLVFLGIISTFFTKNKLKIVFSLADVLLILMLVSLFVNYMWISTVKHSINFWMYVFYILFIFVLKEVLTAKKNAQNLKWILNLILISCCFQVMIAFGQYFHLIPKRIPYFSLTGVFSSPNYLAFYISQGAIIILWKLLFIKNTVKKQQVFLMIGSLFISILFLSKSRGTGISVLLTTILLIFYLPKTRKLWAKLSYLKKGSLTMFLGFIVLASYLGFSNLNSDSIGGRKLILKIGAKNILRKPFFGNGLFSFPGTYNKSKATYFLSSTKNWNEVKVANYVTNPFNDYYLILFELGGLLSVLLLVFITLLFIVKINRRSLLGIGLVMNALIWMLFNTTINNPLLIVPLLLGVSILLLHQKKFSSLKIISKANVQIIVLFIVFIGLFCILKLKNNIDVDKKNRTEMNISKFYGSVFKDFRLGKELYQLGYKQEGRLLLENSFYKTYYPYYGTYLFKVYKNEGKLKEAEKIGKVLIGVQPYKLEPKIKLAKMLEPIAPNKAYILYKEVVKMPIKIKSKKASTLMQEAIEGIRQNSKN